MCVCSAPWPQAKQETRWWDRRKINFRSMTHSATANNKNGDLTTSLTLTSSGTFQMKQGYHICSELTSRSAKKQLIEPKRTSVSQDLGLRLFWNVDWILHGLPGPLPTWPHSHGFVAKGTITGCSWSRAVFKALNSEPIRSTTVVLWVQKIFLALEREVKMELMEGNDTLLAIKF